jgi:hypothetical protein
MKHIQTFESFLNEGSYKTNDVKESDFEVGDRIEVAGLIQLKGFNPGLYEITDIKGPNISIQPIHKTGQKLDKELTFKIDEIIGFFNNDVNWGRTNTYGNGMRLLKK